MNLLIASLLAINLIILVALRIGFRRQLRKSGISYTEEPFITVIVAARNEQDSLPRLLASMTSQEYLNFELIVIDDRSADTTRQICEKIGDFDRRFRSYRIDKVQSALPAKKNALLQGITEAKGSILLFTDADCAPNPLWIRSISSRFAPGVGVVVGPSIYHPTKKSYFGRFVEYEKLKNIFLASAGVALRLPWLAGGANIAYRKEVFFEIGGFQNISKTASGDDDLLIQRVKSQTKWEIDYILDPQAIVTTSSPHGIKDYYHQKLRHFSVTPLFSLGLKMLSVLFVLSNLILYLIPLFLWAFASVLFPLMILFVKIIADHSNALVFLSSFQRRDLLYHSATIEPMLVLHGIFFAIAHHFIKAEWKEK